MRTGKKRISYPYQFLWRYGRVVWLALALLAPAALAAPGYVVVVSRGAQNDPGWRAVAEALRQKHHAAVLSYGSAIDELLPDLRSLAPRYACFVAPPAEVSKEFVAGVHRLTRRLDDGPYPGCFWGILTGYDATNALRIAQCGDPLIIHRVAAGTALPLDLCEAGVCYSELEPGKLVSKEKGGEARETKVPADTTEALARSLTEYRAELFITSGHATERDWQIGYSYRNGQFRCENGVLYGLDTHQQKFPIHSTNPKVYMPVGNCLMGHIDGTNAMALAFLNSAGVNQMLGYTVTTWYGYAGWGCLDYFVCQPGRFTLAEAFLANQVALTHRLQTFFPALLATNYEALGRMRGGVEVTAAARAAGLTEQDGLGLLYDRDVLAFYGDPAWAAKMAPVPNAWDQSLTVSNGVWTFDIKPRLGARSFKPVDSNGSQRGGRPFIHFFAKRLKNIRVSEGADLQPVITRNFILVPNPGECDPARTYRVSFQAEACE